MANAASDWQNRNSDLPETFDRLLAKGVPLHQIEVMLDWAECREQRASSAEKSEDRRTPSSSKLPCRYDVAW